MDSRYNLLFRFELKKLCCQTSTKLITLIYLIFPLVIVFGIVSPLPNFSITMADFRSAADFANAIIGFLNSLGFCYIVLVLLSSSTFSKEIESKYIYFVLSAVSDFRKVIFYKIAAISLVFVGMVAMSSIISYIAYSVLYLKNLSIGIDKVGVLAWGIGVSLLIAVFYNIILVIVNLKTDGNVFMSIILAICTIAVSIFLAAIKGLMHYLPSWATDYMSNRNNLLLLVIYCAIILLMYLILSVYLKRRGRL